MVTYVQVGRIKIQ